MNSSVRNCKRLDGLTPGARAARSSLTTFQGAERDLVQESTLGAPGRVVSLLKAALGYARIGWAVFPVGLDKRPLSRSRTIVSSSDV